MPLSAWTGTRFLTSVAEPAELPAEGLPEIAFAGRSNVGKSSAINALANRRRLAFVSRAPGRTRTINFFDLGERGRLVDLPGYGYAQVSQQMRAGWERLVDAYLVRRSLAGVVLLMDARHPLTASDRAFLHRLGALQPPRLVLLTKSDKLPRVRAAEAHARTLGRLRDAGTPARVLLFSSKDATGVGDARAVLEGWLRDSGPEAGRKGPR